MRATTAVSLALAVAGVAAVPQKKCDAQNILDTCVAQFKPRLEACTGNDWACYCQEAQNLLTCYNVCPNADASGVHAQVTSYCGAYSATLPTTTSAVSVTATAAVATKTTDTAGTAGVGTTQTGTSAKGTSTGTASSSKSSSPSEATAVVPGWGVFAGVVAVLGAFL